MDLIIEQDGSARCIYDEAIDLHALGKVSITRASHVEPSGDGTWAADLSPVKGPLLGPFTRRSDALKTERRWLEVHWLTKAACGLLPDPSEKEYGL